jgi:chaperonin cofactor prefoldin
MYETIQNKHVNILNEHKETTMKKIQELQERLSTSIELNKKVEARLNELKATAKTKFSQHFGVRLNFF